MVVTIFSLMNDAQALQVFFFFKLKIVFAFMKVCLSSDDSSDGGLKFLNRRRNV